MLSRYYNIVPTFQQCMELVDLKIGFSHSVQEIAGKELHSFKYNMWSKEMLEEDIFAKGGLNLRGMCFIDEELVALPFPKFFNLNENKYTTIPWSEFREDTVKYINDKIDGSLISVLRHKYKYYCKSMKSIESDVSKEAQAFFDKNFELKLHAMEKIARGFSPMYEYTSNSCQIILSYGEPKMTYLGCRDLKTGEIVLPTKGVDDVIVPIPKVFTLSEVYPYLQEKGVEGIVLTLNDGTMLKMKSEEYCEIHRIISGFSLKNILESIQKKTIDDIIPILTKYSLFDKIEEVAKLREEWVHTFFDIECKCFHTYNKVKELPRKEAAQLVLKEQSELSNIVFKMLDKKDVTELIDKKVMEILLTKPI